MTEKTMAAVKALIEKDGKILALEVDTGKEKLLTLPGGRVERGEAPLEALHREVEEEVSLEIDIGDPLGMYRFFIGGDGKQVVLTVFSADIIDGELDIDSNPADENITGFEWLTPEEFLERNVNSGLKNIVEKEYRGDDSDLPKLVRDRIPEIIREDGEKPVVQELGDEEVAPYLREKVVEEAEEFQASGEMEELADILEVVDRYLELEDIGKEKLEELRERKRERRGGFRDNIVLERIE